MSTHATPAAGPGMSEQERMTAERLAYFRRLSAVRALGCDEGSELLRELDAVTRERDEAREKLEGTRQWLSRVESELTRVTTPTPAQIDRADERNRAIAEAAAFTAGGGRWMCPICLMSCGHGIEYCDGSADGTPHPRFERPNASRIALKRTQERAAARAAMTDEMVERAARALSADDDTMPAWDMLHHDDQSRYRDSARHALTAALSQPLVDAAGGG